jgi:hypothetical protein
MRQAHKAREQWLEKVMRATGKENQNQLLK